MWNITLHNFESYIIGAEGKIKINEPRQDYFFDLFDPNVTLWGLFFCTCPLVCFHVL